jgi:hypothetical protein
VGQAFGLTFLVVLTSGQCLTYVARICLSHWNITNPWVFFSVGGAVVLYTLYMMVRRRKGERAGSADREPEL